jgi:allantoate deiminase
VAGARPAKSDPVDQSRKNRAEEVIARCRKLSVFSEDTNGLRRTFLSPPMREVHKEFARWMEALGVQVRVDAVGNIRGFYPAADANAPRLLIGSHLDTVPNAGAFDGILGVVLGIALLEELHPKRLPFGIEVAGFSEEEGVRFGKPFIGSRALVGRLDEELLSAVDGQGIRVRDAIQKFGLDPAEIPNAKLSDDTLAYLEFHIEQGPVLEKLGKSLAAVEGIAGQSRIEVIFFGRANHAGTTPMNLRHDALAGAAEWIGAVERSACETAGLVATVGKIEAKPGATNVIAGEARLSLDVRHGSDAIRAQAVEELLGNAEQIAQQRRLFVRTAALLEQRAVAMNSFLVGEIERAIAKAGCEPHRMVSGAGHDAMILAEKVPSAMIFLRTPGGISHDPAESVAVEDVEKAIACGVKLLEQLAASPEFCKRAAT